MNITRDVLHKNGKCSLTPSGEEGCGTFPISDTAIGRKCVCV